MLNVNVYLIFSIFLYVFKVYIKITHDEKMNLVIILSLILAILNRNRDYDIIAEIIANLFVNCLFLGLAYYLPNFMIGYLSALIFRRITLYLNLTYNLALVF